MVNADGWRGRGARCPTVWRGGLAHRAAAFRARVARGFAGRAGAGAARRYIIAPVPPPASLAVRLRFAEEEVADDAHLLARVAFDPAMPSGDDARVIQTGLRSLRGPACEDWLSPTPVVRGRLDDLHYAHNDELLMGWLRHSGALEDATCDAYRKSAAVLAALGFPHFLRTWNFLSMDDDARDGAWYRRFCRGRRRAGADGFASGRCAATVIGVRAPQSAMHFVAGRAPGAHLQNPRQTAPERYPHTARDERPAFARATRVALARGAVLFVSGTASIVGHESLHQGDAARQSEEALRNIDALLAAAGDDFAARGIGHARLYLADAACADAALAALRKRLAAPVAVFEGEVCRPELLAELEPVVA